MFDVTKELLEKDVDIIIKKLLFYDPLSGFGVRLRKTSRRIRGLTP